jgi:uncharacterized protein (TIGR03066 family)
MLFTKGNLVTALRFLLTLCAVCVVTASLSAGDKPKDLIVGKWEPAEKNAMTPTIEFTKDNKLKISVPQANLTVEGTYKFVDDNNVEVEISFMGQTQKEKLKVEVTKDSLTTTDSKGKNDKFTRAK